MTWNHRIVRTDHPDWAWAKDNPERAAGYAADVPRYRYGVHEAYYDSDADRSDPAPEAHSWTVDPVELWTEDLDTLRSYLAAALAACDQAVIDGSSDAA